MNAFESALQPFRAWALGPPEACRPVGGFDRKLTLEQTASI